MTTGANYLIGSIAVNVVVPSIRGMNSRVNETQYRIRIEARADIFDYIEEF